MQLVSDIVGLARDRHDGCDPLGQDSRHVGVTLGERFGRLADDVKHAPGVARSRDRDGELRSSFVEHRRRPVGWIRGHEESRQRGASCPVTTGGQPEGLTKDAGRCRNGRHAGALSWIGAGNRSWVETSAADLPDDDKVVAVGAPDAVDRRPQGLIGLAVTVDEAADRRCDRQVEMMALGFQRVRGGRPGVPLGQRGEMVACCRIDDATSAPRRVDAVGESGDCPLLRGAEEALEVTQPVSTIAARVDPVVAQPSGVAPGANRVRVDAKQLGGLGDRKGRVRGSDGVVGRHGSLRKCEVDAPTLAISQFLPIGRWSPWLRPCTAASSFAFVGAAASRGGPPASRASVRRQADPRERDEDRGDPDQDDGDERKSRVADEPGTLARAARVPSGAGTGSG